jgi:serine/threonine-protein kinase
MLSAMAATGVASVGAGRFPVLAKYEVKEEIGHGGMATVYRAHDPRLSRDVAVKVIHAHLRDSHEAKTRFHAEAKAVAMLRHPNIVEVYDVSSEGEPDQYLVVELVRGVTLRKLLADRGPLPPEVAASLAVEMLAALAHAHAMGVVHRDIKPENVMLELRAPQVVAPPVDGVTPRPPHDVAPGDRVSVKLMDFGIAKLLDAQGVTSTGQVLGSPAHMAPEQIEGGDVDARADVFGLGVLLYETMVGHLPFEGKNPAQVLRRVLEGIYPSAERESPKVGKRWSAILDKALARSPSERYASATEMREAILSELSAMGIASARAELEAWLDDPAAPPDARDASTIAKLCERGREARSKGRVLDAASHFNRALAYAPHDPALLKIVSSMHRSRAVRDFLVRAVPLLFVSAALCAAAFFGTRAVRHRLAQAPSAVPSAAPAPSPSASAPPPVMPPPAPTRLASPLPMPHFALPAPKAVERSVTLELQRPPFGVLVAVDGASLGEAHTGQIVLLDGKPHELRFTCMEEGVCEPGTKVIPAGEEPQIPVTVSLNIKPAAIVVDGDPGQNYGLEEFPGIPVRVGFPTSVHLEHNVVVHVVERPSGRRVTGRLSPGKETHVTFSGEAP